MARSITVISMTRSRRRDDPPGRPLPLPRVIARDYSRSGPSSWLLACQTYPLSVSSGVSVISRRPFYPFYVFAGCQHGRAVFFPPARYQRVNSRGGQLGDIARQRDEPRT